MDREEIKESLDWAIDNIQSDYAQSGYKNPKESLDDIRDCFRELEAVVETLREENIKLKDVYHTNGKLEQELSKYKDISVEMAEAVLKYSKYANWDYGDIKKAQQLLLDDDIVREQIKIESDNDMSVEDVNFIRQPNPQ